MFQIFLFRSAYNSTGYDTNWYILRQNCASVYAIDATPSLQKFTLISLISTPNAVRSFIFLLVKFKKVYDIFYIENFPGTLLYLFVVFSV